ncbi:MAG: MarR family transcriptional regulator [Hellea sp.]
MIELPSLFLESNIYKAAYLGKHAGDLSQLCHNQAAMRYQEFGIIIPVYTSSTLHCLKLMQTASLADIAGALNATHQVTSQRVKKLIDLGLVDRRSDPNDARRYELFLTQTGKTQANRLENCMEAASQAYVDLFDELGFDLSELIRKTTDALRRKPLGERFPEHVSKIAS